MEEKLKAVGMKLNELGPTYQNQVRRRTMSIVTALCSPGNLRHKSSQVLLNVINLFLTNNLFDLSILFIPYKINHIIYHCVLCNLVTSDYMCPNISQTIQRMR